MVAKSGRLAVSLLGSLGVLLTAGLPAGAAETPAGAGDVYLVQGVPGATVDVDVDDHSVDSTLAPKEVMGPLELSEGKHSVTFSSADWEVTSSFDVSGDSTDVVVHWPAEKSAMPDVTVFANDVSPVAAGKGRVTIAHTAVVPPADVRVDEKVLFANIANGEFVTADVPATTYSVDIVPTGATSDPLLGPVDLAVKPGALTRVFAIGQPRNGSMDVIVQVLDVGRAGSPAPEGVDAGSAGLVATSYPAATGQSDGTPLVVGGLLVAVCAGAVLVRRRARW